MPIGGRYRGVLFLVVSLVAAVLVTLMIYNLIQEARRSVVEQGPKKTSDVVVAAVDIPPGWTITKDFLATRELPEEYIPDEVYRQADEVIGRVAMERVLAGEFLREERLADPEAGQGLAAIIPRGMRAMQVPIKSASAVSGFLNPHNFVDIIAVCARTEPPEVRTLLQSVTVLAVDDRMADTVPVEEQQGKTRGRRRVAPSVTLALTPVDAERVKHAFSQCRITLSLRNDIDVTNIDSNTPTPSEAAPAPTPTEATPTPVDGTGRWHAPRGIDPVVPGVPTPHAEARG